MNEADDVLTRMAQAQTQVQPESAAVAGPTLPPVRLVAVGAAPLDVVAHERAVADPRAGAQVVFTGVVRDHDHDRRVLALEYEGHPSAEQVLREIAADLAARPGTIALAVSHRVGPLLVGDVALVAAVATAHRQAAFALCAELVDTVKDRLPIWKRQVFADGTDEWVNCP
ncbi:molybdopterin synthase subunit MoaE [Jatrophihabitans endophyticus]|uniref:Molybdopterin synthase subunit MoaE n=1 Tax=Jatrophihabitans endophyticus TaxID=1206085 RepID=A0A1M5U0N1_9ACTN|nr:molybdenum cofactor biosynthesis protein MoaE [Jatrophihabitans endophyticus]SHH56441.1 molybdopterin synthase subunit MoaE [Jatrophihabitans endophyticus]